MDEDKKSFNVSLVLFIIAFVLIVIAFIVLINYKPGEVSTSFYKANGYLDAESSSELSSFNISNTGITYELFIKDNNDFELYVDAVDKVLFTGKYEKSFSKYTLSVDREYSLNDNCYKNIDKIFNFKSKSKTFITSDINDSELIFNKMDHLESKYNQFKNMDNCKHKQS